MTDYAAILNCYSLQDIFELNDLTEEDILQLLVEEKFLSLPEKVPLEFDD